jgi:hypothetical protein
MGTDELAMGWIKDETGRAVALPRELGGIPPDEIGATGCGLAAAIEVAAPLIGLARAGARFKALARLASMPPASLPIKGRRSWRPATAAAR